MSNILVLAIAGGFGIFLLCTLFHVLLLRLLWKGLEHRKAYAQWIHLLAAPVILIFGISALNSLFNHDFLKERGYDGMASWITSVVGLTWYTIAYFSFMHKHDMLDQTRPKRKI